MNKNFVDDMLIEEEIRRVDPELTHGEQWDMVCEDMKQWALKKGLVNEPFKDIVVLYAIDRGWLQENFTGMEICDPFWDWQEDHLATTE